MKVLRSMFLAMLLLSGISVMGQQPENYISCLVDGKEWVGEARRLRLGNKHMEYHGLAAFQVNPDIQVWIRFLYPKGALEPGSYPVSSEAELETVNKKTGDPNRVWVLIDYTEETSKMGHGYHDGESGEGTITIEKLTPTYIEGTFEVTLTGVYYKKKAMATITGRGLMSNLQSKAITEAGGGMFAQGDPHYHENTKKEKETDTIVLSQGKFRLDWSNDTGDEAE